MIWFLVTLPFRVLGLGFKAGRGSAKLTHRTVRTLGYRRVTVFAIGVAVGLLAAPSSGAELRARLRDKLDELRRTAGPGDLADAVREELASSPRTWHLPQPAVTVADGGRVTLTGEVPDAAAAADLERTARAVRGVTAVENRLTVAGG